MLNDIALTDALLALVALVQGFRLLSADRGGATAGVGLLMVALAAAFGAGRFWIGREAPDLAGAHQGVTNLAALVGLPLVGVGYATTAFVPKHARAARPYAFVVLLIAAVALIGVDRYRTIIGGIGMVTVLVASPALVRLDARGAALGALGAIGVVVSGLAIHGEGTLGPLSRVAWFHLGLAGSAWALGHGLWRVLQIESPGQGQD